MKVGGKAVFAQVFASGSDQFGNHGLCDTPVVSPGVTPVTLNDARAVATDDPEESAITALDMAAMVELLANVESIVETMLPASAAGSRYMVISYWMTPPTIPVTETTDPGGNAPSESRDEVMLSAKNALTSSTSAVLMDDVSTFVVISPVLVAFATVDLVVSPWALEGIAIDCIEFTRAELDDPAEEMATAAEIACNVLVELIAEVSEESAESALVSEASFKIISYWTAPSTMSVTETIAPAGKTPSASNDEAIASSK
mmetsp:Transcript_7796/g.17344  ORF Transcript_7796/g.17344 Transcript_7796/m.17344 type:complete len:258 (+) Transcript_7796:491-1264(+)